MSYRNDPRWLDAQERLVARMGDDENPDSSFERCVKAAYEMWLIETGRPAPEVVSYAHALGTYALIADQTAADAA